MPKLAYLSVRTFLGRLLAAVVVGTATLLMMKPEPRTHWSIPPAIRITMGTVTTADRLRRIGLRITLHVVGARSLS